MHSLRQTTQAINAQTHKSRIHGWDISSSALWVAHEIVCVFRESGLVLPWAAEKQVDWQRIVHVLPRELHFESLH